MDDQSRERLMDSMSLEERIAFESRFLQRASQESFGIAQRAEASHLAPLSFAQERMWFMDQLSPGQAMYNVPWAARLKGPLHQGALERALAELARRHEVLRTTYREVDGIPQQFIHPEPQIPLQVIRASKPTPPTEEQLLRQLEAEARRPFDLASDHPLRATLFCLDETDHVLLLVGHHIALDGWTCSTMNKELAVLYQQLLSGKEPNLPLLSVRYADVAVWQKDAAIHSELDEELTYWIEKLRELPPTLDLPISSIDSAQPLFHGDEVALTFSENVTRKLKNLAHTHLATPFMLLAAAVFALLHRYTDQSDLAIGTPVAGRVLEEMEPLVGLFVNTLVLRADLTSEPSFAQLIERVRAICLEAYAHQSVPFEQIAAALGGERTVDRSPVVQVMLAYRTFPAASIRLPGTVSQSIKVSTGTSQLDLSFELWDTAEGMAGRIIYSTRRFRRNKVESLASHFSRLLEEGLRNPDRRIAELPMLNDNEYERIVRTWNATKTSPPRTLLLHTLFELAAQRFPNKMAVVCEGKSLTYQELDARADLVAGRLRELGAAPNRLIGVSMHRSTDLIVALLGVLKAGAAYLPLDPSFPPQRTRYMMEDASVPIVITQPEIAPQLQIHDGPLLVLEDRWYAQSAKPQSFHTITSAQDLAYVMYTSGSTGKPKGVMVTHANVVGFLNAFHHVVKCGPDRVSSNAITYAFDTSVEEIFAPLCYGGTLHVVPYEISLDGGNLAKFILEHGIDTTYIVPDLLPGMVEIFRQNGGCGPLRCLRTGLAPKKQRALQLLRDVAPDLRIVNAYGPTEVTYGATAFDFTSATHPEQDVSIGVPYPDYQVYIVNKALEPVPIGVTGEILIGGVGVARGYLNLPDLTEERFIPNPFGDGVGDRVYRTGDLATYQEDGTIDFLGRKDSQVKIRGHRIELREIELALEAHPGVLQCHTRVYTLAADDVRIGAFITTASSEAPSQDSCYRALRSRLPEFMIPASILVLPAFPLLPSGKIDPDKLPPPIWGQVPVLSEEELPRGTTEQRLAPIWEDVLQIPHATRHTSFFEMGGHSLLAIRLISRIQDAFGLRIPIRTLFENPTLETLAMFVDKSNTEHNLGQRPLLPHERKDNS